jgi:two-component system chemotaxis response regulator CheB
VPNHDIIVVGASAGGVEVLLDLAAELPPTLPASLFIVVHTAPEHASELADLLSSRGRLPAVHPLDGDAIVEGRIYVAPADAHLLVREGFVQVVRGPRENGHRPAVDPLFRSASWAYGPRVVGVVLSGFQDCGTAGMMSVKARGGIAVVQDPASAVARDMPESVLRRVEVDHVVHPLELPALLVRLAAEPAPRRAAPPPAGVEELEGRRAGKPVEVVCPSCHGALSVARVGPFEQYRCHVGHAFTLDALARAQADDVERALWAAVRALEESAGLSRRLSRRNADAALRRRFGEDAAARLRQAELLRKLLLDGGGARAAMAEEGERVRGGAEGPPPRRRQPAAPPRLGSAAPAPQPGDPGTRH